MFSVHYFLGGTRCRTPFQENHCINKVLFGRLKKNKVSLIAGDPEEAG
jgi:hypothetical protein